MFNRDMEPTKVYEYLTRARQRLFDGIRPLDEGAHAREFPFGHGTLLRTLTHILASESYYILRMQERAVPPYEEWPIREEEPLSFAALEAAWNEQASATRAALSAALEWGVELEYRVTDDDGRPMVVNATPLEIFTQLVLHEVHHRAQVIAMLKQLGVSIGDVDFNMLMYRRREASPA